MRTLAVSLVLLATLAGAAWAGTPKKKPCFKPLSSCPSRGCEKEGSPGAFVNIQKRTFADTGQVTALNFKHFEDLQTQVETKFNHKYATLPAAGRARLRKMIQAGGQTVGEGTFVEISGYLAAKANPNPGEGVNCRLTGSDNSDYHINLVPRPNLAEYDGIVVEMIPQQRNAGWTTERVKKALDGHALVRVRGRLFFDNHHMVNKDAHAPLGGQPKRMSLWEVHPVTEFDVCTKPQCEGSGQGWKKLEDWQ